jgi:hypothetical protein
MALRFQSVLLLAHDSDGDHASFWWVVAAALVIMALSWFFLSIINNGDKGSLWKDKGSEMDSGPLGHD